MYELYCHENVKSIKDDIDSLDEMNDLDGVCDLSLLISSYFEKKEISRKRWNLLKYS